MVTKQKHFLDSLRQMVSKSPEDICPNCKTPHEGDLCPENVGGSDEEQLGTEILETAYLVDLVSNHKIRILTPNCDVGRDETNDIVVSGDQSISRHHLHIISENDQYYLEDNDSRHGTFLNGTQIKTREIINDGDVIKIGVSLFWFVVEANAPGQDGSNESGSNFTALPKAQGGESVHLHLRPDNQTKPSDPGSSTMNEIPVIANEETLIESLKLKTRSFDQAGLFTNAQSQMATISPQLTAVPGKSSTETQSDMPALSLDPLSPISTNEAKTFSQPEQNSARSISVQPQYESPLEAPQELNMSPQDLVNGATLYDQLMDHDLTELKNKYNRLKDEIDRAQKERQDIADQLNTIRTLGTNLIGGKEENLIESCYKVFSKLGWQISLNSNDPQELQLKLDRQFSIARIIWTTEEPERSHLGQLSIAQTRLWCDQGEEPKGILIISRLANQANEIPSLTKNDYESELAKYAAKKNVCMMTSMQVLAIYRDLVLKHSDINTLREKITSTSGWLEGFNIKPHS